jgi:hypothetical protein
MLRRYIQRETVQSGLVWRYPRHEDLSAPSRGALKPGSVETVIPSSNQLDPL